jgi:hypothetical protein
MSEAQSEIYILKSEINFTAKPASVLYQNTRRTFASSNKTPL